MSLPKFPKQALQVLRIIRDEVKRPDELPTGAAWTDSLRWGAGYDQRCLLGMHGDSTSRVPISASAFANGRCRPLAFWAAIAWWEKIKIDDAQAAMDFIWPGGE